MTAPQRLAAIGAEMMPMLKEEARRQRRDGHSAGRGRPKKVPANSPEPIGATPKGETCGIAGKAVGVFGATVQMLNGAEA